MLDLKKDEIQLVRSIINSEFPGIETWVFGSRIKGTARPSSDLDLALITDKPLPLRKRALLKKQFSESSLPFTVDLVDWSSIDDQFKLIIQKEHYPLP